MSPLTWLAAGAAVWIVCAVLVGVLWRRGGRIAADSDAVMTCRGCKGLGFRYPDGEHPYIHECPTCCGAGMTA